MKFINYINACMIAACAGLWLGLGLMWLVMVGSSNNIIFGIAVGLAGGSLFVGVAELIRRTLRIK